MDNNRCNVSQHDTDRGIKSFSFLCWMLCIMGQKVSTKSLMAILSDCFPSSSCLIYANIGNNSNIRINGERNGCHSRLGDHFLSLCTPQRKLKLLMPVWSPLCTGLMESKLAWTTLEGNHWSGKSFISKLGLKGFTKHRQEWDVFYYLI